MSIEFRIIGAEPIFTVANLAKSREHYELLGFTTSEHDEFYGFATYGSLIIHLAEAEEDDDPVGAGAVYLHVDDADALAEQWRSAGVSVIDPEDFDYGKREGSHVDPDGNLIRFGSPVRT